MKISEKKTKLKKPLDKSETVVSERKSKYSKDISEQDLDNIDEGIQTPADIAETRGVPPSAVTNKARRRKERLNLQFTNKPADANLPNLKQTTGQYEQPQDTNLGGIPIDATEALKGMWQFVDTALVMASTLSRDRIEYKKLEDKELDRLATVSNQSPFMRQVATQEGLSGLIIIGTVVGTFGSHIKFNLQKKHKENDPSCDCKKCKIDKLENQLKVEEAKIETEKKDTIKFNQDTNNIPNVTNLPTPESVKNRAQEIRNDYINNSDATPEYILPEDKSNE